MVKDLDSATFYSLVVLYMYAFAFILGVFIGLFIIFTCAVIIPNTKVYRRGQVRTLETTV